MPKWSSPEPDVDRRLVDGLNGGKAECFGEAYGLYAERLYDYALSLLHDPKAATDIVHDAFVDAFRRAPRMRDRTALATWLYGAVRRRCVARARGRRPHWDDAGEDVAAALERLEFHEQECVLLTVRHGLPAPTAAAVLGRPVRGVRRSTERAPAELRTLLAAVPPAVLPAALRHRVLHTATDPELAGYRADIAGRGGALTPDGMPQQPGVPSSITRRWIFTGGATAGALIAAGTAALLMRPDIPGLQFVFPQQTHPGVTKVSPSGSPRPSHTQRQQIQPPIAGGPPTAGSPHPSTSAGTSSRSPSASAGTLTVGQTAVQFGAGQHQTTVDLTAAQGVVTWTGSSSSDQVKLSVVGGTIPKGSTYRLTVNLQQSLLQLPGQAVLTFADTSGRPITVAVSWGVGLL